MTTTTAVQTDDMRDSPSLIVAGNVRALMGRQRVSGREMARRLRVSHAWLTRRLGLNADVEITFEESMRMAAALGVGVETLLVGWLPRLGSNQQPSGYVSPLIRGAEPRRAPAEVIELDGRRRRRSVAVAS